MIEIFVKISEMIKNKETTQGKVAENLGIAQGNLSSILSGKSKPSRSLIKFANIVYGSGLTPHPDPIIESVIKMMGDCDQETKRNIYACAEKEKLLKDLMKEKQDKEAA